MAMERRSALRGIYKSLLDSYGPQGWWPLLDFKGKNPTKTGSITGYHPGDYTFPRTGRQAFEICAGAILTQNTAWPNVEKALLRLKMLEALSPAGISGLGTSRLADAIRPAGYFNQKAKKLEIFAGFFQSLKGRAPQRAELLSLWGIGPETADSMLLYAFKVPSFVVDAYTKRIFLGLGFIDEKTDYEGIKEMFEDSMDRDYALFQEYHALIVEHAKRYYSGKADRSLCPLRARFSRR